MDAKVMYCSSCGAPLNTAINQAYVFCQFCGCKNVIESQQMSASIKVGGSSVEAHTDLESILNTIDFYISEKRYEDAKDSVAAAILSGCADYRVYIDKAMINLQMDDNRSLFETMDKLYELEQKQEGTEVTDAVRKLMGYRGKNGVQVLHNATFHENAGLVEYCVNHGADVNSIAGMNRVSPISIMFVPVSSNLSKIDGTPFVRDMKMVKQIRSYLMKHGAKDKFRWGM